MTSAASRSTAETTHRLGAALWAPLRWAAGMLVVMSVVFLLTEALPGDYADSVARADRARAQQLREQWGLNAPVVTRLGQWWLAAVQGDLGNSLIDGQPVLPRVLTRCAATFVIAAPATLAAVLAALVMSFAMAWCRGGALGTPLAMGVAVVAGLPEVVLLIALVLLLAVTWQIVPAVSLVDPATPVWLQPQILILPSLALALPHSAWGARMLRGSADDLLASDVARSARRRGVPCWRIAVTHVLPRWAGPLQQTAAYTAASILGGSVVVESVLAYPGLGQALTAAVAARDTPTVQGIGVVVVGVALALLTIADLGASRSHRPLP